MLLTLLSVLFSLTTAVSFPLQLANVLSTEALFYTCIFPFIAFFGAFAFVFYPLRDVLHPTGGQQNQ
jgi:AAA family ATP:ADP antiporter